MKAKLLVVCMVVAGCVGATSTAWGLKNTETRGRLCRNEPCHVETFSGGYYFKGTTRPSQQGQKVFFFYKRRGSNKWHLFGRGSDTKKPFYCPDGTPFDRINGDHRWRELVDINGFTGYPHRRWVFRATFVRQDGYAASSTMVRVKAAYGD